MARIKTLLFDFGDIFLTLDKPATVRELQELGLNQFSEEMLVHNKAYEIGAISTSEFLDFYQELLPTKSENQLINAWNAILKDLPMHRLQFLQELASAKKYQLILLSNTNDLHIDWVKTHIKTYRTFKNCFDAFYLSHEINFRKPDASIYNFVVTNHKLNPEEILFIDDTLENTEAANKLGFHTWNLNPATEDITELFDKNPHLF